MKYNQCINRVELQGTVGSSRITVLSGRTIIYFSLMTEQVAGSVLETTWHHCSAIETECETGIFKKGTPLHVEGRIKYTQYTDINGNDKTIAEIVATEVRKVEL